MPDDFHAILSSICAAWRNNDRLGAFRKLALCFPEEHPCRKTVVILDDINHRYASGKEGIEAGLSEPPEDFGYFRKTLLAASENVIDQPGYNFHSLAQELLSSCRRIRGLKWLEPALVSAIDNPESDDTVKVAFLGIFSSGKSSLINAILGESILKVGVVPVTAALTVLEFGDTREVEVRYVDGKIERIHFEDLSKFTDDRESRGASKSIERVIIRLPSPILRKVTFFDTPGFNSGIELHDTVTERVILGSDVVFWVFNATKAGSEVERINVSHIRRSVGKAIGIVNMIDDISPRYSKNKDKWKSSLEDVIIDLKLKFRGLIENWVPTSSSWMSENHAEGGMQRIVSEIDGVVAIQIKLRSQSRLNSLAEIARTALALRKLQSDEADKWRIKVKDHNRRLFMAIYESLEEIDEEFQLSERKNAVNAKMCSDVLINPLLIDHLLKYNNIYDYSNVVFTVWQYLDIATIRLSCHGSDTLINILARMALFSKPELPQLNWTTDKDKLIKPVIPDIAKIAYKGEEELDAMLNLSPPNMLDVDEFKIKGDFCNYDSIGSSLPVSCFSWHNSIASIDIILWKTAKQSDTISFYINYLNQSHSNLFKSAANCRKNMLVQYYDDVFKANQIVAKIRSNGLIIGATIGVSLAFINYILLFIQGGDLHLVARNIIAVMTILSYASYKSSLLAQYLWSNNTIRYCIEFITITPISFIDSVISHSHIKSYSHNGCFIITVILLLVAGMLYAPLSYGKEKDIGWLMIAAIMTISISVFVISHLIPSTIHTLKIIELKHKEITPIAPSIYLIDEDVNKTLIRITQLKSSMIIKSENRKDAIVKLHKKYISHMKQSRSNLRIGPEQQNDDMASCNNIHPFDDDLLNKDEDMILKNIVESIVKFDANKIMKPLFNNTSNYDNNGKSKGDINLGCISTTDDDLVKSIQAKATLKPKTTIDKFMNKLADKFIKKYNGLLVLPDNDTDQHGNKLTDLKYISKKMPKEVWLVIGGSKEVKFNYIEFRYVPNGQFIMGSDYDENGRSYSEGPQHKVNIKKQLYMSKYLITQEQWEILMGNCPSHFKEAGLNAPVENVSYMNVDEMLTSMNNTISTKYGIESVVMRLPSESEWEYACRAGTKMVYYRGDTINDLNDIAWFNNNSIKQTHPVGKMKPNNWGFCDMLGNVWEWCEDGWHEHYNNAPISGEAWKSETKFKVCRGGSWKSSEIDCRCATRIKANAQHGNSGIGFRLVFTV